MNGEKLIRRSRRLASLFTGRITAHCCFIHIPKCAGNSIVHGLLQATPLLAHDAWIDVVESRVAAAAQEEGGRDHLAYHEDGDKCEATFAGRRAVASYFLAKDAPVVCGHFLYDRNLQDAFGHSHRFVTMIRPPVERMISHYAEEVSSDVLGIGFADYLETAMARRHANTLTRYLAGIADLQSPDPAAIALAKKNLGRFDLVGLLDRTDVFQARLSELLGARITIGHERKASAKPDLSPEIRRRVEEMCAGDEEVFQYALKNAVV